MRYLGQTIAALLLCAAVAYGGERKPPPIVSYLQDVTVRVLVKREDAHQSGTGVVLLAEEDGKRANYVVTACHVLENRYSSEVYDTCQVLQEYVVDGRVVGHNKVAAEVLHYSAEEDCAILRLVKPVYTRGVTFSTDVVTGDAVRHAGVLGGSERGVSITEGIVTQIRRKIEGKRYFEVELGACSGSSGGGVFRGNRCVGLLTRGVSGCDSLHAVIPAGRLLRWAESVGVGL